MNRILVTISGGLLLAVLAVAPWALGGQPPWVGQAMVGGVALAVLFRLAGSLGQTPRVPLVPLLLSLGLIGLGWAALAHADEVGIESRTPPVDVRAMIRAEALFLTAMLLAGLLAADLGRDPRWRRRAARTLVWTAAALALVGTVGHLPHVGRANPYARFMSDKEGEAPFGPFNYHANAGAFLNLAVPLALLACEDGPSVVAAAAIAVGIAVNASRAAQAVAMLEGIACAILWWRTPAVTSVRNTSRLFTSPRTPGSGGTPEDPGLRAHPQTPASPAPSRALSRLPLAALVLVAAVIVAVGSRQATQRWSKISAALNSDGSRPTLWRVCWHMAQSAGWRGDGPGTFKLLFPHCPQMDPALYARFIVKEYRPGERVSMWNHVHDDYLQTLIEWGWPGTALWLALFAGGLATAGRAARRGPEVRLSAALAIALAGVLLHALVDFPLQVESIRLDVALLLGLAWSAPLAEHRDSVPQAGV